MIIPRTRGIGQAPCPSPSQLMGIVDPSDPCQAAASVSVATAPSALAALQAQLGIAQPATPGAAPLFSSSMLIWAAVALGAILLLKSGGRH